MTGRYFPARELPAAFSQTILPTLAQRRQDGFFPGYDGQRLHYAVFTPEKPEKTVVLSHGFTESTEKYHELVYYFLCRNFTVWALDHRGHGLSARAVPDRTLTYIHRFEEYAEDFALFTRLVAENTPGRPYLFAHSMGCAVGALYLERQPDVYARAFLSSPMIQPDSGSVPPFLARAILRGAVLFGKGRQRAFISPPYTGKETFEASCKTCRERFDEYEQLKERTPDYQNSCATYGWAYQSLRVKRLLLRRGMPERITIPVFLAMAGRDTTVARKPQLTFAARLPHCTTRVYRDAKHEIYGSEDATLFPYLDDLFAFFGS